jgi:DNA-binding GntR family transcriptional regulator
MTMERTRRATRYGEVAGVLRREIEAGVYSVGDSLPTEAELCARFDIGRFTAREALRRLEEAGLVARRQGSGTTVIASDPEVRYSLAMSQDSDVLAYASNTVLVPTRGWAPVTAKLRDELGLDDDREWLSIEFVRRVGEKGSAVGLTTVCVDATLDPTMDDVTLPRKGGLFARLAEANHLHLSKIDQEIYATTLTSRVARRLGSTAGGPAIGIIHRFSAEDVGVFEVSRAIQPAEHFHYKLTLVNNTSLLPSADLQ